MPEPSTPDSFDAKRVPPFPPGDKDRGVSREANEDIGYGPANGATTKKIRNLSSESGDNPTVEPLWQDSEAMAAQQAVNSREAQAAWLCTPDGKRFTELSQKLENGEQLSSDESQELAQIKARRQRQHD